MSSTQQLRGAGRLAITATQGVVDLVEAMHAEIARLPLGAHRDRTTGITGLVYRSVRGATRLVGGGLDLALGAYELSVTVTDLTPLVRDETARATWMTRTRAWDVLVTVPGDLNGDFVVNIQDFLYLLSGWGPCLEPCPPTCLADINDDCTVDVLDFQAVGLGHHAHRQVHAEADPLAERTEQPLRVAQHGVAAPEMIDHRDGPSGPANPTNLVHYPPGLGDHRDDVGRQHVVEAPVGVAQLPSVHQPQVDTLAPEELGALAGLLEHRLGDVDAGQVAVLGIVR